MRRLMILAVASMLVASACGGATEVGADVDVGATKQGQDRLGEVKIPEDDGGAGGGSLALGEGDEEEQTDDGAKQAEEEQKAKDEQVAAQREQAAIEFAITNTGYNPYFIRIFEGGTIKVVNTFDKPASVTADKGEFDSGMIQPGGSWVGGPFNDVGKFNFHDEGRPFVVGTLEVIAK